MPLKGERRRKKAYDFEAFHGYRGPRFTPIPDEFLDHQLAHVTSAEAKVMLFLFRKTYGYRKSGDRVSLAQLEHGTTAMDGTIIDRGTGLSRATIWRALKGLQKKGLIEVHRQITPLGDLDINYYRIREELGPVHRSPDEGGGEARSREQPNAHCGVRADTRSAEGSSPSGEGSFRNETTPVSELNHRSLKTKLRGSFSSEPTRTDFTREDSTLSRRKPRASTPRALEPVDRTDSEAPAPLDQEIQGLEELARDFLEAIGYDKPAAAKREKAVRILRSLQEKDGYTLDELETACKVAASIGARGPELLPHVIGKGSPKTPDSEVGERVSRQEHTERKRWEDLTRKFGALPLHEQEALLAAARGSNAILARRPVDHPLVRAAAIAMLDGE